MIKAVLFDYEGVIAAKTDHRLSERLGQNLGIPREQAWELLAPDQHAFLTGKIDEAELWRRAEQRYGRPIDEAARDVWHDYAELRPQPEIVTLAGQLKKEGIVTGVLSNVIPITLHSVRSRDGYAGFDPLILSCEIGLAKPDEAIYAFALDKLNLKPEEVLYIDDMEKNLPPAGKLGMYTVLAESPEQTIADTKQLIMKENGITL